MILIVDPGRLDFCGASGPSVLVAGQHGARRHAGEPRLACSQGPVKRLLEVTAVWLELHTRNACDAAVFYGEVLEWAEHEVSGCCEVSYEEDQVVLRRGGRPVARWNSGPVEAAAARPQLRPRWLVHFRVPDLKAAQAAVVENAGVIVPDAAPWDEGKLRVTVSDPDGGLFTLDQTAPPAT